MLLIKRKDPINAGNCIPLSFATQCVVPGPAVLAPPGSLFEMQSFGLLSYSRPTESESAL